MDEYRKAGLCEPVSGRLPKDNIAYKLTGDVLRLESEQNKHPEFWCEVRLNEFKKRTRESERVCIVVDKAEQEHDGNFTGHVSTAMCTITESALREEYNINLKHTFSVVDGDAALYRPLAENVYKLGLEEGPFAKVLILH